MLRHNTQTKIISWQQLELMLNNLVEQMSGNWPESVGCLETRDIIPTIMLCELINAQFVLGPADFMFSVDNTNTQNAVLFKYVYDDEAVKTKEVDFSVEELPVGVDEQRTKIVFPWEK